MKDHHPRGTQLCPECGRVLYIEYPAHFRKHLTCGYHRFESDTGWIGEQKHPNPYAEEPKKDDRNLKILAKIRDAFGVYASIDLKNGGVYGYNGYLGVLEGK